MKTRRYCPKCGRILTKSKLQKTENRYDFQCNSCDEDFWRCEVLHKTQIKKL